MTRNTKTGSNKIGLISDIHYHLWQAFSNDGGMSRLQEVSNVVQEFRLYCIANKIKTVCILGDIFEKRGTIDSVVYNKFASDLKSILNSGIEVYIIPGNHDQDLISNATWDNSLEPLSNLSDSLHIISQPSVRWLDGHSVFFAPYLHDHKELRRLIEEAECEYSFIHAGIVGAKMIDSDYKVKEGLNVNGLKSKIFSGHLHTPHSVGCATYLGSPLHHGFNDCDQEKGFVVLDLDSGKYERVPTHYPKFVRKTINNLIDIYAINSEDYYRLTVSEKVLDQNHHAHLQAHTRAYEVVYMLKKETENYYAKFDSDLRCLRKYISKEFDGQHKDLYLKAKEYL